VVLSATALSMLVVIHGWLEVPILGSLPLFFVGVILHLFATSSMGIFMGTLARSMPQFGLMLMLVLLPLEMLSGGTTPRESMPQWVRIGMLLAPNAHFVSLSQGILFRGAGMAVVWPQFLALALAAGLPPGRLAPLRPSGDGCIEQRRCLSRASQREQCETLEPQAARLEEWHRSRLDPGREMRPRAADSRLLITCHGWISSRSTR